MTRSTQSSDRLWIVTGASGHLGNTVVRALAERGERVRAFVLEKNAPRRSEAFRARSFPATSPTPRRSNRSS
ncbi:MAG: NmrA family NAD(P)-binding protein [Saccharofermentanales bacterium]|jgi:uncharacterized protein YbjT (DUF2867 family)